MRVSLAAIRKATATIWANEASRIVQDYTDHGIKHSERLVNFANNLLKANDGRELTAQETYLLLAGIYLHDIGMQCDVVKFPQIKERAETLGIQNILESACILPHGGGYSFLMNCVKRLCQKIL